MSSLKSMFSLLKMDPTTNDSSTKPAETSMGNDSFIVYVQQMDGRKTKLTVEGTWTVKELKVKFGEYHNIRYENIRFIYRGGHLKDDKKLQEYKMVSECVINSTVRSVGG